jgi:hypothetical protein
MAGTLVADFRKVNLFFAPTNSIMAHAVSNIEEAILMR